MAWKPRNAGATSGGSVDESLAGMAKTGAPRKPMGTAAASARNASAAVTTPTRPRNYGGGADPSIADAGSRKAVSQEALGASYRIGAWVQPPLTAPEAGQSHAGGRLLPSATVRSGFKGSSGGY